MKLSFLEKRWIAATFEAFAPPREQPKPMPGGTFAPRPGEVDYVGAFVRVNARATPVAKLGLRVAVLMAGTSPLWLRRKVATMDSLPVDERTEILKALADHPLALVRELTWLLKVQTGLTVFATPGVRARSGYDREATDGAPLRLRRSRDDDGPDVSGTDPESGVREVA